MWVSLNMEHYNVMMLETLDSIELLSAYSSVGLLFVC